MNFSFFPQVRSCWTLWPIHGTSSSATFCPCCRPSSTLSRYVFRHTLLRWRQLQRTDAHLHLQGKEPSVRQLALLHFRNIIALNLKLDEALSRPRARVPPSIIQMLMILQVRFYPSVPRSSCDHSIPSVLICKYIRIKLNSLICYSMPKSRFGG